MTREEVRRFSVVHRVIEGSPSLVEASELLQLSTRQVLRIKNASS
jgi:hypothetical protein